MAVKHTFVSAVPDGGNTSLVRPSDWNNDHDIDTSAVTPVMTDKILIKDASASDALAHILVSALFTLLSTEALTFTNKRVTASVGTTASSATPTPDADAHDLYTITALAAAAELQNPTGTPTNGQALVVRIKDDGTARALTYDTQYRAVGVTLPTTTVISKTIYLGMIWNSASSTWDVLGVCEEA